MRSLAAKFEPLDKRLRESGLPHARLYFSYFVRYTPKFHGVVGEIGNRKRSARVRIARLADRAGIQKIAFFRFDSQRGKEFGRSRTNLENFEIVIVVRKSALMMSVSEKYEQSAHRIDQRRTNIQQVAEDDTKNKEQHEQGPKSGKENR